MDQVPQRTNLWGCTSISGEEEPKVSTVVTDASNRVIFPANFDDKSLHFKVLGFNAKTSQILVFTNLAYPNFFNKGEELRIWYSEDLFNSTTGDNGGTHCINVYVKFP